MNFSGRHYPKDVILTAVRWYVRYSLSYRDVEELLAERGVKVDHSTINRWVVRYAPLLAAEARRREVPVGASWRMDETYIKVRGQWKYDYRAVDKAGATIDFLLTVKRDVKAARRFLRQAVVNNCTPDKINIDKSGANTAAIRVHNDEAGAFRPTLPSLLSTPSPTLPENFSIEYERLLEPVCVLPLMRLGISAASF